ncbi:MAG: hypothetical protein GY832_38080 [Chloroflexi bacterium]|nr:hypothetical protein [Chloroflexota bacterium]
MRNINSYLSLVDGGESVPTVRRPYGVRPVVKAEDVAETTIEMQCRPIVSPGSPIGESAHIEGC